MLHSSSNATAVSRKYDCAEVDLLRLARESHWLSQQDSHTQREICSRLKSLHLNNRQAVQEAPNSEGSLYFVAQGSLTVLEPHPLLGHVPRRIIRMGNWFGETGALGRRSPRQKIVAAEHCTLLVLSRDSLVDLLAVEPQMSWAFFNLMALNVTEHLHNAVDLLIMEPRLRLYSRLLTFAGRELDCLQRSPVTVPLTQEELALAANMSRSTVYNTLLELEQEGICRVEYRRCVILDVERLFALVHADL